MPADIEAMRLSDPALAGAWRTALRDVLSPLLSGGARVTGFRPETAGTWFLLEEMFDEADRG